MKADDDVGFPLREAAGIALYKWRFGGTGSWQEFIVVDADPLTGRAVIPTVKNGRIYKILVRRGWNK